MSRSTIRECGPEGPVEHKGRRPLQRRDGSRLRQPDPQGRTGIANRRRPDGKPMLSNGIIVGVRAIGHGRAMPQGPCPTNSPPLDYPD